MPNNATTAVSNLYEASRKAPMSAALHELMSLSRDTLQAYIAEAEKNATELAELKKPKEIQS